MAVSSSTLRPRKKPIQPGAVQTVSDVLEAAAQIVEAHGFERFNTTAVAEREGVSIGSLYQYVPGKDALVIALMRREKERFRDDAAAALAAPTGRDAVSHLVGAAVRQQLDRPELARLLDIEEMRPEAQRETPGAERSTESVRGFRSCPLITPKTTLLVRGSSLHDSSHGCGSRQTSGALTRRSGTPENL